jgi:hypothetical protein
VRPQGIHYFMKPTLLFRLGSLIALAFLAFGHTGNAAPVFGVDWGGNFTGGRAINFGSDYSKLGGVQTGDYDLDSSANDRAQIVQFGTVFTPSTSSVYASPDGKTKKLYTGGQVANIGSGSNPSFNTYRFSSKGVAQASVDPAFATSAMRESVAYYSQKADFLGGLSGASNLKFDNIAGGATLVTAFANVGTSGNTGRLLVEDGTSWYVSATVVMGSGASLSSSYNPYADLWYAYDPSVSQFLDTSNLGIGVAGSSFNDIEAFGVFMQTGVFDGTTGDEPLLAVSAFSAAMVASVPEPTTNALLGLSLAVVLLLVRRRHVAA